MARLCIPIHVNGAVGCLLVVVVVGLVVLLVVVLVRVALLHMLLLLMGVLVGLMGLIGNVGAPARAGIFSSNMPASVRGRIVDRPAWRSRRRGCGAGCTRGGGGAHAQRARIATAVDRRCRRAGES
jgi:hypothetical protein